MEKELKQKKLLATDLSVALLRTEEEFVNACEYFSQPQQWKQFYGKELHAVGYSNAPILADSLMADAGIDLSSTEELLEATGVDIATAFTECMAETGIFTQIPREDGENRETYAGRYTSYWSMYNRSGTNCRMITTLNSRKGKVKALSAEERGLEIDRGWGTTEDLINIYIVDGKISYFGSEKYVILPYTEGLQAVKEVLASDYPKAVYKTGAISHEYVYGDWLLHAEEEESYALMLEELGLTLDESGTPFVLRYSSSNVGSAKMAARLFVTINGVQIPLGKPQNVWHHREKSVADKNKLDSDNGCSIDDFKIKLGWIGKLLKENEDLIEALGNTPINHAAGCLQHLLSECKSIPVSFKQDAVDEMDAEFGMKPCTAMDVYLKASSIAAKGDTPTKIIALTEDIAELQFRNFLLYDKELETN